MDTLVQFGAGNIGRSLMGQLFSRSGYKVIFVDINKRLVTALNDKHTYRVIVKRGNGPSRTMVIENVWAISADDIEALSMAIAEASYIGTSVGKSYISSILPSLARGIELRERLHPGRTLDIIIAENMSGGAQFMRKGLVPRLSAGFPIDSRIGFVETAIGKMVPFMKAKDVAKDPLQVFTEAYNELIVDGRGFKGALPAIEDLKPVGNIQAFVDRKLFIHSLGHAAISYLGWKSDHGLAYIWEALALPEVRTSVEAAMRESALALSLEYPEDLPLGELEEYCADLLSRLENQPLGDTIQRVGRDLYRKLAKDDRLVGAILLAARRGVPYDNIARIIYAAIDFAAADECGRMLPSDREFLSKETPKGLLHVLTSVSNLSLDIPLERSIIERVMKQNGDSHAKD
ncbi:MAG: mannitol-1-phosphate 5-dehydrogenase [Spirochaetes bacterium]|nr:mannitol-1-phosphate 5-dehydrogenase [Spirochaetota bacterium]